MSAMIPCNLRNTSNFDNSCKVHFDTFGNLLEQSKNYAIDDSFQMKKKFKVEYN